MLADERSADVGGRVWTLKHSGVLYNGVHCCGNHNDDLSHIRDAVTLDLARLATIGNAVIDPKLFFERH